MRLSSRQVIVAVDVCEGSARPVALRIAGLTYRMETSEAINLANQLADAVTQLKETP